MNKGLDYRTAGVDIDAGNRAVKMIAPWIKATRRPEVLSDIEGFAGLFRIDTERYPRPVMIAGTDGVGTKIKVAQMAGIHNTIGVDLVAMCVNDILVHGAEPLFFLDYLAVNRVVPEQVAKIVEGVARGCEEAGCSLIGGETAEMPGFYGPDEYDLAGFAVGVANEEQIITGKRVESGDVVIGLNSSGIHSNGFSLVRKILFEVASFSLDHYSDELGKTLAEELLTPTRIYVKSILPLLSRLEIKAQAHITGGGIAENLSRVIPQGLEARIRGSAWNPPPIFSLLARTGRVDYQEMWRTFNMGIGFVVVVKPDDFDEAMDALKEFGENPMHIGEIYPGDNRVVII